MDCLSSLIRSINLATSRRPGTTADVMWIRRPSSDCSCFLLEDVLLRHFLISSAALSNLCWGMVRDIETVSNASFTPVRHLCSVVRHPSSVISRPLQSLPFTPISLFRAVDTDFCVPTVLNTYSPGKWLTEALFVGNSLSTVHYHDLWSASVVRLNRSRTDFD